MPAISRARASATPTASERPARKPAPCSNRQPSEKVRLPPATAVQPRPRRPRPAVCHSAISGRRCTSSRAARRLSSLLVESTVSTSVDLQCLGRRAERRGNGVALEKRDRIVQAIALAADALQLESGGVGFLEHLRHPGARHPDGARQRLAGVEFAVGKTAQQRKPRGVSTDMHLSCCTAKCTARVLGTNFGLDTGWMCANGADCSPQATRDSARWTPGRTRKVAVATD